MCLAKIKNNRGYIKLKEAHFLTFRFMKKFQVLSKIIVYLIYYKFVKKSMLSISSFLWLGTFDGSERDLKKSILDI